MEIIVNVCKLNHLPYQNTDIELLVVSYEYAPLIIRESSNFDIVEIIRSFPNYVKTLLQPQSLIGKHVTERNRYYSD